LQQILTGFFTGLSLIIAIGAQNAFVLRQGLKKEHVLVIVLICAISDALLITLGIFGLGALIQTLPWLLEVLRWVGVAYLIWFGISSLRNAFKDQSLSASEVESSTLKKAVLTTLALTFLNPHVYLDTLIFLGGIGNQFGDGRWLFAIGAVCASFLWFFAVGFAAQRASALMNKPVFWKVLDVLIAGVMFAIALTLVFTKLG
jgi:L-lysine exporter family protein LysE/ArgO